jgi:hypothetical protein
MPIRWQTEYHNISNTNKQQLQTTMTRNKNDVLLVLSVYVFVRRFCFVVVLCLFSVVVLLSVTKTKQILQKLNRVVKVRASSYQSTHTQPTTRENHEDLEYLGIL